VAVRPRAWALGDGLVATLRRTVPPSAGPPEGGGNRGILDAALRALEPFPPEPVRRRTTLRPRLIGEVRLPIAGPYRPRARLFRLPDGRLLWHVRLWEYDRAVSHLVGTPTLRTFARTNRLPALLAEIDALVARAVEATHARR
jgi:hypothetical protein